jgi:microsomal dipeptidase-like Zn-dependent dipeptidase
MEQLGIIVDLAHASPRTVQEVLAVATRPVVVSHTGVAAVCPGSRNLTLWRLLPEAQAHGR